MRDKFTLKEPLTEADFDARMGAARAAGDNFTIGTLAKVAMFAACVEDEMESGERLDFRRAVKSVKKADWMWNEVHGSPRTLGEPFVELLTELWGQPDFVASVQAGDSLFPEITDRER